MTQVVTALARGVVVVAPPSSLPRRIRVWDQAIPQMKEFNIPIGIVGEYHLVPIMLVLVWVVLAGVVVVVEEGDK